MLNRFKKSLDWPFNVSGRGKVSDPFGDFDRDGLHNLNDCRPRNPKKQDIGGFFNKLLSKKEETYDDIDDEVAENVYKSSQDVGTYNTDRAYQSELELRRSGAFKSDEPPVFEEVIRKEYNNKRPLDPRMIYIK